MKWEGNQQQLQQYSLDLRRIFWTPTAASRFRGVGQQLQFGGFQRRHNFCLQLPPIPQAQVGVRDHQQLQGSWELQVYIPRHGLFQQHCKKLCRNGGCRCVCITAVAKVCGMGAQQGYPRNRVLVSCDLPPCSGPEGSYCTRDMHVYQRGA